MNNLVELDNALALFLKSQSLDTHPEDISYHEENGSLTEKPTVPDSPFLEFDEQPSDQYNEERLVVGDLNSEYSVAIPEHIKNDLPNDFEEYVPNSPEYNPESPGYSPESPGYNPESPGYNPKSPGYNPKSPGYNPESPGYDPESPGYDPDSPEYAPAFPTHNSDYTDRSDAEPHPCDLPQLFLDPPVNEITEENFIRERYLKPKNETEHKVANVEEQDLLDRNNQVPSFRNPNFWPKDGINAHTIIHKPNTLVIRFHTPDVPHVLLANSIRHAVMSHVNIWTIGTVQFGVKYFCESNYTLDELSNLIRQLPVTVPSTFDSLDKIVVVAKLSGPQSAPGGESWKDGPALLRPNPSGNDTELVPFVGVSTRTNFLPPMNCSTQNEVPISPKPMLHLTRIFPSRYHDSYIQKCKLLLQKNRMFSHYIMDQFRNDEVVSPRSLRLSTVPSPVQREWLGVLKNNDFCSEHKGVRVGSLNTQIIAYCNPCTDVDIEVTLKKENGTRHAEGMGALAHLREEVQLNIGQSCTVQEWRQMTRKCPRGVFRGISAELAGDKKIQIEYENNSNTNHYDGKRGFYRGYKCDGCIPGKPLCGLSVQLLPDKYLLQIQRTSGTSPKAIWNQIEKDFDGWIRKW
jgi:hypothetical protein